MVDLSIVIVSWNTRDVLRECLKSVAAGLGKIQAEVFVVDNASRDGSPEMVAAEFPQFHLIANQENVGFAAANNQALKIAKGKYQLLLNPDTVVLGDVLTNSLEYMEQHPEVGMLGCRVLNGDRSVQLTCGGYPTLWNLFLLSSGLFRCKRPDIFSRYQMLNWDRNSERDVDTITGCYMFCRASAVAEVGLLDESFFCYGEETDWCKRFSDAGWILRFAPVGEIVHYGSLSSRQCNHRRDIMLTDGLIRLHLKHGGRVAAVAAWSILAGFQATRWAFWSVAAAFSRKEAAQKRRDHFLGVMRDFGGLWPVSRRFA
ncbi:MAG: glycosyltransferase family 2 protein [Planctomycetes bacterium]|nr:glycosyltransferase family 2 protein [Planctomycetota bacterium]